MPFGIQTPKHAARLRIDEVSHEIVFGARCALQIFFFAQHTVGSSESPQYACIENSSLFGIGHGVTVAVYAPQEAALLVVYHLVEPERQDVLLQFVAHVFC